MLVSAIAFMTACGCGERSIVQAYTTVLSVWIAFISMVVNYAMNASIVIVVTNFIGRKAAPIVHLAILSRIAAIAATACSAQIWRTCSIVFLIVS